MAESAIISLIQSITTALVTKATDGHGSLAKLLERVHSKMTEIKRELEVMNQFVRNIELYRGSNRQALVAWAKQVQDTAYEIEEVVDEYTFVMGGRTKSYLHSVLSDPRNAALLSIASKLDKIEENLARLNRSDELYAVRVPQSTPRPSEESDTSLRVTDSAPLIEDDKLVGVDDNRRLLTGRLTQDDPRLTRISVLGMGGVGKTTLISSVYSSKQVLNHFSLRAWVSVSQNYDIDDLLRRIIADLCKDRAEKMTLDIYQMDHRGLIETVRSLLTRNRYLVILDDVWNTNVLDELNHALLDDGCGSRIVVTTRNQEMASASACSQVIKLEPLEDADAWALFCKNAFLRDKGNTCPVELEDLARRIVEKCYGLPIAIVSIANLLQQKAKSEEVWKSVHDSMSWSGSDQTVLDRVPKILSLSIKDLPYYLRNCLLYCSIFPEDYRINRNRVIRLWVAEGFVKEKGQSTMEEVAEDYLRQLIGRCLLQAISRNESGRVRSFRVHDIVRDIIVTRSKEENFVEVYDGRANLADRVRRLSLTKDCQGAEEALSCRMPRLRSVHLFASAPGSLLSECMLLRVLDLSFTQVASLPDEVANLFNLRYLGIRKTKVERLPKSLGNLRKLETLDAFNTSVKEVPRGITELENLRHLFVGRFHSQTSRNTVFRHGVKVPSGVCGLKGLQTLKTVIAGEALTKQLGKLQQMRSLDVREVTTIHSIDLFASISRMERLTRLVVMAQHWDDELLVQNRSRPPPQLRKLSLYGRLEKKFQQQWFGALPNLTHLVVKMSRLSEDALSSLLALPNLVSFYLLQAYDGATMRFGAGSGPKLRTLVLCNMDKLSSIRIDKGALRNLNELKFVRCKMLMEVPKGIENLTCLQKLEFEDMPEELMVHIREKKAVRLKLEHIPIIKNWMHKDGHWNDISELVRPRFSPDGT